MSRELPHQQQLDLRPLSPQQQHVLELLRLAKDRGVGGVEFTRDHYIYAYAQRVSELRLEFKLDIVKRRDGNSKVYRYWMAEWAPKVSEAA